MRHNELMILALAMEYQDLIGIMLEETGGPKFFTDPDCAIVCREIEALYPGEIINSFTLRDICGAKVRGDTWRGFHDALSGTYESGAERIMVEAINRIKRDRAQSTIIRQIDAIARSGIVGRDDVKAIQDAAESMGVGGGIKIGDGDLEQHAKKYDELRRSVSTGLQTGFPPIDDKIDNLFFGEMFLILGRTWTGKTFCALNMLDAIALNTSYRVGFFSLEMPGPMLYERMCQLCFDLSRYEVRQGYAIDTEKFRERYRNVRVFDKVLSLSEIRATIQKHALKVVFIDFMGLIRTGGNASPYERISSLTLGLKTMAKNMDIALVVLHQLSRAAGHGQIAVTLDMARESGQVEELSDIVLGIWRPGKAENAPEGKENDLEIALLKNKRGLGVTGHFETDPRTGRIRLKNKEKENA
jgi:KaiC/GvpD/RAD55 family RecA-like ATPase